MSHLVNWRKAAKEIGYLGGKDGNEPFKLLPKTGSADYNTIKTRYDELQEKSKLKKTASKPKPKKKH